MKQDLNVYTVMLILAFLATVIGCLFLFLEMRAYDMQKTVPADLRAPTSLPSVTASATLLPGASPSKTWA
jgi:hypothetical protein